MVVDLTWPGSHQAQLCPVEPTLILNVHGEESVFRDRDLGLGQSYNWMAEDMKKDKLPQRAL